MRFHVARRPVFNRKLEVYGYELLHRQSDRESFYSAPPDAGGDEAASNLIVNSFYNIGIDGMTAGRRAFIRFTGSFMQQGIATLLPPEKLVIEIPQEIGAQSEVLENCAALKQRGYEIAVEGVAPSLAQGGIVDLADIVKVDCAGIPPPQAREALRGLGGMGQRFLAASIDTREMFTQAREAGFHLFQGNFFSKPIIVSGEELRPIPANTLRLIQMVNAREFDFRRVAYVIMRDVSLSYQLLKLVNSVAFGFTVKIKTIHHALVALGAKEVRKWVSLLTMMGMGREQPKELCRISLVRAKFAEYLCVALQRGDATAAFMTGLFSLMDVLVGRSFDVIFRDISVEEDTYSALVQCEGSHRVYMDLIVAYERGQWEAMESIALDGGIDTDTVAAAYREAIHWCNEILDPPDETL